MNPNIISLMQNKCQMPFIRRMMRISEEKKADVIIL